VKYRDKTCGHRSIHYHFMQVVQKRSTQYVLEYWDEIEVLWFETQLLATDHFVK